MKEELKQWHIHSFKNKTEIEKSEECGCFYCQAVFSSSEVVDYIDEGLTALCPRCGMDTVIGDASGINISKDFLHNMFEKWIKVNINDR